MVRKSKLVYILGSITMGVVTLLVVFASLILSGVIGVSKTKLVFVSDSAEYVYDGSSHVCDEWSIISGELKEGHTAKVIMTATQTDVGTVENAMSITILDQSNVDITDYYEIESHFGTISVIQNNITIVSDNMQKIYDGETLVGSGYVLEGAIAQGSNLQVTFHNQLTDVGTLDNSFSVKITDQDGIDKTGSYNITSTFGTLEIIKRSIKLGSSGLTKVYDGTPLVGTQETGSIIDGTLVGEDTINYIFDQDGITNVGKMDNEFTATILNSNGENVSSNYKITYGTFGDLEVTKRSITVETASAITGEHFHIYNGKQVECENCQSFEIVDGNLVEGQQINAIYEKYIDAGSYDNIATFSVGIEGDEGDYTNNYEITPVWGEISIEPLAITISTPDFPIDGSPFVYDGQTHRTDDTYTLLDQTALAENQTLIIDCLGEAVDAGNYVNDADYDIVDERGVSVLHNYVVKTRWGELVIQRKDITITTGDSDPAYIYDGEKVFCHDYEEIIGIVEGENISLDFSDTYLIAPGRVSNIPVVEIIKADGSDSKNNYNINANWGELVVNERPIIIKTNGDKKVYDGIELTKNTQEDWSYDGEYQVISAHQIVVNILGKQLDAGTSENVFEVFVYENDIDVTSYYEISMLEGILEVSKCPLAIMTDNVTRKYNATELKGTIDSEGYLALNEVGGYTVSGNLNGQTLKVTPDANAKITNAGNVGNRATYTITDENGQEVTHNYSVNYVEGELTIEPIKLVIQSLSYSREFDGQPLVYDEKIVTGEQTLIPEGQNLEIDFNDRLIMTYVTDGINGLTPNAMNVRIVDDNGSLVDANNYSYINNYDITKTEGVLEITPRSISFLTKGGIKIFDKTPLSADGYEYIARGEMVSGHELIVKCNGTITYITELNGGTVSNSVDYESTKVLDENGNDITVNYNLSAIENKLTIKPKPITIKMLNNEEEGDVFYYDGTQHSYARYLQMTGVIGGHELVILDGSAVSKIFPGNYDNLADFVVMEGNQDVSLCYDLQVVAGKLTINKRPIAIKTQSASKVYDATPLKATNQPTVVSGSLVGDHQISATNFSEITHVLENGDNIADIIIVNDAGTLFTQYYEVSVVYGQLTIIPRDVTISTAKSEKVYDGTALYTQSQDISISGLCGLDYLVSWNPSSIIDVGNIKNEPVGIVLGAGSGLGENHTTDYNIIQNYGSLIVTPRYITILTDSAEQEFNGQALTKNGYSITSGSLIAGHTLNLQCVGSITYITNANKGAVDNIVDKSKIKVMNNSQDVSKNYDLDFVYGTLTITPKPITIQMASNVVEEDIYYYDGTAKTYIKYFEPTGLLAGHSVEIINDSVAPRIYPGTYQNIADFVVIEGSNFITPCYEINVIAGQFEIYKRVIAIKTGSATKVYDATPLSAKTYGMISGSLVSGHSFSIVNYKEITHVRESGENTASVSIITSGGSKVTQYYDITVEYGDLMITPTAVTIITAQNEKEYDGTALTTKSEDITVIGLCGSDKLLSFTPSSITDVGTIENKLKGLKIGTGSQNNTSDYDIVESYGSLEITARNLTLNTDSGEKIYDATPLYAKGYAITTGSIVTGHTIIDSNYKEIIHVRDYGENTANFRIVDGAGKDVTKNYNIIVYYGTLTITPKTITVDTVQKSQEYNGLPLYTLASDITVSGLCGSDQILSFTPSSITDVGIIENKPIGLKIGTGSQNNTSDYNIVESCGSLEITARNLTLTTDSGEKTYDATPLYAKGYVITTGSIVTGHTIIDSNYKEIIHVRDYGENTANFRIIDGAGKDVTKNYNIIVSYGTLTITPKTITVDTVQKSQEYNGLPLYTLASDITVSGLCGSDQILSFTPSSITDVGEILNEPLGLQIGTGSQNNTADYIIQATYKKIIITPRQITVKTNSAEKVFDGTPLTIDGEETIVSGSLLAGHTFSVQSVGTITYITSANNGCVDNEVDKLTAIILNNDNKNVTANYEITYEYGKLTIVPRTVTVKMASNVVEGDIFYYDGTAKTYDKFYTPTGLLPTHSISIVNDSLVQRVTPGVYQNTATFAVKEGGLDITPCYTINVLAGEFEIFKAPLTVMTANGTKVYDGTPLSSQSFSFIGSLVSGHSFSITEYKEITHVRENGENTAKILVFTDSGRNVTQYYDITPIYGELKITPKTIVISTAERSKEYDGTPLTTQAEDISVVGLISPDGILSWTPSSLTAAGIAKNEVGGVIIGYVNASGATVDNTTDYTITTSYNNLIVHPRQLIIIAPSKNKVFDGTPLTCNPTDDPFAIGVKTPLLEGYEITDIEYIGSQTLIGQSPCTIGSVEISKNGQVISNGNFKIEKINGVLQVYAESQGEGGGSGGGEDDPQGNGGDPTGDLKDVTNGEPTIIFQVLSPTGGSIYLRQTSYGDFNGSSWGSAVEYGGRIYGTQSLNYLVGHALEATYGLPTSRVSIRMANNSRNQYFSPYYEYAGGSHLQSSDVLYSQSANEFIISYYNYDYLTNGKIAGVLPADELAYRNFVKDNYLYVDSTSAEYLQSIISAQGWDKSQADVISKVAQYIQGCAQYNVNYNLKLINGISLDDCQNVVVSFMRDYQEGVCRHYASAATLMFRQLGIPARYTVGYLVDTSNNVNTWMDVKSDRGHAWVEVYIDELGWVKVEVTGGSGFSGGDKDEPDENVQQLTVRPYNIYGLWDGVTTFSYSNSLYSTILMGTEHLVEDGYKVNFTVDGARTDVGYQTLTITSLSIWKDGVDVTKKFNIETVSGRLQVYRYQVTVTTGSASKIYDGTPLTKLDGWTIGALQAGHVATVECSASITNAGTMRNDCVVKIVDSFGNDVTDNYRISKVLGELEITTRSIKIIANSATLEYDENNPMVLTDGGFTVEGDMPAGQKVIATIIGSQPVPGSSPNIVSNFAIKDGYGKDYTSNYNVTTVNGTLTVTAN